MRTQADRMRTYNTEQTPVRPGVKFYYSGYLAEKPVNLVIKKTLLKAIADTVFEIMPDRVLRDGAVIYEASKKL